MQFPTDIGITDCEIKTRTETQVSESRSFKRHARTVGGQRWELRLTTTLLDDRALRRLFAFTANLHGRFNEFSLVLPKFSHTQGAQITDCAVKTTTLAGKKSIPVRSLKSSSAALIVGDFIQFSNHKKIYQLQADVNSSAAGQGTLTIYPALISDVTANTAIKCNNVAFNVALTNDVQSFKYKGAKQQTALEFDLVESIN